MSELDIAVIGIACRFPGAKNADEFWDNLIGGAESLFTISDDELKQAGIDPALYKNPHYVKLKGMIPNEALFDANFFGYSSREAELIDPQQRIFLEEAWNALEQAGYNAEEYPGAVGVFAGCGMNTYLSQNLQSETDETDLASSYQVMIGNDKDFLATRVAYKLNLTGPAITVQSACSTSLVAIHLAAQSLLHGECDLALAGGVSIGVPQKSGYLYQEGMILSPDGHCRAFDAEANGTAFGAGAGVVVLKRLDDALNDHDHIYVVIKGSAINNDGSKKVGFTAPSVSGQERVVSEAQTVSNVHPNTITYIETHGTGTPLGDPIEVRALTQAFRRHTNRKGYCAIGSVKTNIGHLDTAAGVAGFIKAALAVQKGWIPPTLHFKQANPQLDLPNSPFYINNQLVKWETGNMPRRAGVNSLGLGGTNAHVILEELSTTISPVLIRPCQLLMISAKTATALDSATANLSVHLQQHPETNLADIAYTLHVGRKSFLHRRFAICRNAAEAAQMLTTQDPKQVMTGHKTAEEHAITFLFPGQGSQYTNMGKELYQLEPVFHQEVDRCTQILIPILGFDLRQLLYPAPEFFEEATSQLQQTAITQPALFVVEYALAKLWMSWGIKPSALIGHSLGEYVAACLSGVFSLEDALKLVVLRARLMQSMPPGDMLAVQLSETELFPLLGDQLSLAAINSSRQCVVSGPSEAVQALENNLSNAGIGYSRLHTSHAFHSAMMEPILAEFTDHVKHITLHPASIPWISTVTGDWVTAKDSIEPDYWVRNIRQTVRFADAIGQVFKKASRTKVGQVLLEVGPGNTLTTLAKQQLEYRSEFATIHSLRRRQEQVSDEEFLLNNLGELWMYGVTIDWDGFHEGEQRYRVPLPTYPFERQRFWIDAVEQKPTHSKKLVKRPDIADWFYIPSWKRSYLYPSAKNLSDGNYLLFLDQAGLGADLAERVRQLGGQAIKVRPGNSFTKLSNSEYILNAKCAEDYQTLIRDLQQNNIKLRQVVHLWNITTKSQFNPSSQDRFEWNETIQSLGFYSLLYLAQAIGQSGDITKDEKAEHPVEKTELIVISNNMQNVIGSDLLYPEKATLLGPVRVISQENPNLHCRSIDISLSENTQDFNSIIQQLVIEINTEPETEEIVIAYRGQYRWVQTFESSRMPQPTVDKTFFKQHGVYLITDGLDGIGLTIAEHLARTVQARLILVGHSAIPPSTEWGIWLSSHLPNDPTSHKIQNLQELEQYGAKVWAAQVDVTEAAQLETIIFQAEQQFGRIQGIILANGHLGDGLIQLKTEQSAAQILAPKVQGTLVLDKLFRDREVPLDFLILCSSISSVLGAPGQVDYCAANAFLDAFANWGTRQWCSKTISINWDAWQEVDMATGIVSPDTLKNGLLPSEAMLAMECILTENRSDQVLISATDFSVRYKRSFVAESHPVRTVELAQELEQVSHGSRAENSQYIAPRTSTEKELAELWGKGLGIEKVGVQDDFFALGGHSLLAVSLVAQIKKRFGKKLSLSTLLENGTIEHLAQMLEAPDTLHSSPLVQIKKGNGTPFILVHPIGGNILCYNDLVQLLVTDHPVYGLQSIGLQGEQKPLESINSMAAAYVNALRSFQLEGPYLLAGWSMGGVVAFEMAQQLRHAGQDTELLILIDSWLPVQEDGSSSTTPLDDFSSNAQLLMAFFGNLWQGDLPEQFQALQEKLSTLPVHDQIELAVKYAQELGLGSGELDMAQIELLFNVFKSNSKALDNYKPDTYLGPIIFCKAEKEFVTNAQAQLQFWSSLSSTPIKVYNMPGDHYTLFAPPSLQELAGIISSTLHEIADK